MRFKRYNNVILRTSLEKTLCSVFGISDLKTADLKTEAKELLISAGLTESDLTALTVKIGV